MGTNASYFMPHEVAKHHDVLVIEGPSYEAETNLVVAECNGLNVRLVDERDLSPRALKIFECIDEFKPDVIHIFYHHQALELGQALRKKYDSKIKLLLDIRTPLLEDKFLKRLQVQFKNITLQKAFDMVTSHSSYSIKTVFPVCGLPSHTLSYGVDIKAFKIRTIAWDKENVDLVYTGAIAKKRKIEHLLLSFKALLDMSNAMPYNFKLHLYGSGNRINEMKALAEELKITKRVIFHGVIIQKELSKNLHKNAIGIGYVPFGIYKQAPALKTIEYMCAGLNVLASNTQPTQDLISTGFQVTPYDNTEAGFAKGILEICDTGWNKRISESNATLAKQFDWQEIVKQSLLPIYQKIVRQ